MGWTFRSTDLPPLIYAAGNETMNGFGLAVGLVGPNAGGPDEH